MISTLVLFSLAASFAHGVSDVLQRLQDDIIVDSRRRMLRNDKEFILWVNEEDHLRIVSMQKGGDIGAVFKRFCMGITEVEREMKAKGHEYMWSEHLGYILACPSNLGTGIRAG